MVVGDVVTFWRGLINDPSPNGRWSDSAAINFYNLATQCVLRDALFPQSRLTATTVANQQEYPLPEIIQIYRVYVAGQLIVPTTLETLEGTQIQLFDQGFNSGIQQAAPPSGSGGPTGVIPGFSPSWVVQQSETYPFQNIWGSPAPDAQPWAAQQRPRYYQRGGSLGLVPPPANAATLVVDCLRVLPDALNLTDQSFYPSNWRECIAWKMAEYARFSDDSDRAQQQAMYAAQKYEQRVRQHRDDISRMNGEEVRGPKLYTKRNSVGNNRNASPGAIYWVD